MRFGRGLPQGWRYSVSQLTFAQRGWRRLQGRRKSGLLCRHRLQITRGKVPVLNRALRKWCLIIYSCLKFLCSLVSKVLFLVMFPKQTSKFLRFILRTTHYYVLFLVFIVLLNQREKGLKFGLEDDQSLFCDLLFLKGSKHTRPVCFISKKPDVN